MEQTLQALGGILLRAIPTVFLLIVLNLYLKFVLFKPLEKVLKEREDLTAGARKAAGDSLALADRKAKEYEDKFRDARAEVYRDQEETRRQWLEDQAKQVADAHERSAAKVSAAKEQLAAEAAAARQNLIETGAGLADKIATTVLARNVS